MRFAINSMLIRLLCGYGVPIYNLVGCSHIMSKHDVRLKCGSIRYFLDEWVFFIHCHLSFASLLVGSDQRLRRTVLVVLVLCESCLLCLTCSPAWVTLLFHTRSFSFCVTGPILCWLLWNTMNIQSRSGNSFGIQKDEDSPRQSQMSFLCN